MARLLDKVLRILSRDLENFDQALESLPGGRLSGVVISSTFERKSHAKRQEILQKLLSVQLTSAELRLIGAIATLTPAEATLDVI